MAKALLIALLILSMSANAKNHNRDTSISKSDDGLGKPFTVDDIKQRLEIRGEIYFLDSSGKKLLHKHPQYRKWHSRRGDAPIESNWSIESNEHATLALHHVWTVKEDGTIEGLIEQYDSLTPVPGEHGKVEYGKLLKRDRFLLADFAPLKWVSENEKKHRMVVVFTPSLREDDSPKPIAEIPISGSEMTVTDSKGLVWTERVSAYGKYVGIITHRGALFMSYYPFKGSQPMGVAKEGRIELQLGGNSTVKILSESPFLPEGVPTTVYAIYRPDLKTAGLGSTQVKTSDKELEFLQRIEE